MYKKVLFFGSLRKQPTFGDATNDGGGISSSVATMSADVFCQVSFLAN